ncbi:hypothetical protein CROQUDRAFT_662482 [Cronartium quercuum f. sp. fusiforme G11]|uniref:Arginyl-tRNA--protein transferase 1 n=1 Tax=Cronartium quercuum f. sp. fusiforme G11 TaxID=708437 RepID=A0A9P6NDX9_9BASI|nr:hypothetical protein CROQUDRAFT_662482 [Cronartium quercuum f. sp. fusiforme G11]
MNDQTATRTIPSAIIEPCGFSSSKCGYCHSTSTSSSHHFGFWAHRLSPEVYQSLLNKGWRRSGSYLYLPHNPSTCCPTYPIRCSAKTFKPTKSQRQTLKRWKTFLLGPNHSNPTQSPSKQSFDLLELFSQAESNPDGPDSHHFEIKLEPASFSEEKYVLYQRYQIEIHKDPPEKLSRSSFRAFLCNNPFPTPPHSSTFPPALGSYHASYFLDHQLIALSVIDILPEGISSVYFVWEPSLAHLSLGKISALRELAWVQTWMQPSRPFEYYFLGFYIHSCPKMKYKAEYQPSDLLNPATERWYPLLSCLSKTNQLTFEPSQTPDERVLFNRKAESHFESGHDIEFSIEELTEITRDVLGKELSSKVYLVNQ